MISWENARHVGGSPIGLEQAQRRSSFRFDLGQLARPVWVPNGLHGKPHQDTLIDESAHSSAIWQHTKQSRRSLLGFWSTWPASRRRLAIAEMQNPDRVLAAERLIRGGRHFAAALDAFPPAPGQPLDVRMGAG